MPKEMSVRAIMDPKRREEEIQLIHEGADSEESSALSGHRGIHATQDLISERFYWPGFAKEVRSYITSCKSCQLVNTSTMKSVPELHPVHVPNKVMFQIGANIATLPPSLRVIDYFSKWSEAVAIPNKTALEVAKFVFDVVCRHGCSSIQINDKGIEIANQVSEELHKLTGTKQKVTSAYHSQANGLAERQNRTIKNQLLKVLGDNVNNWPNILQGVLFAHRTTKHRSTGFSPFFYYTIDTNLVN